MNLTEVYTITASLGVAWMSGEVFLMFREAMVVLKRRKAKAWSRLAKLGKICIILGQTLPLIIGLKIGANNWLPIIYMLPIAFMYTWHAYLACRYKFPEKGFTWPKLHIVE